MLVLCFLLMSIGAFAQQKFTLSGYVKDGKAGETLIGATVYANELSIGTTTNEYGFYSLSIPAKDSVTVRFSFIGFDDQIQKVYLNKDLQLDIELSSGETLDEILVSAESVKEELNSTQTSVTKLTMREAKLLPALFGEVDIIKTLQLKPGINSGGEGTSGVFVRGGSQDQNLFLLDEAVVYNPSHLFGLFSTFNSDAVKDVKLYKGGFPAQYGGRLSSVLDIRLNDGNRKKFSGAGGLGLISSRLTLEGPIEKDKASFVVSGRRTYVDLITEAINQTQADNESFNQIPAYFFYDLNAKVNYDITEKDKIYLSGYLGRDQFNFNNDDFNFKFNWGNATATARWNHIFNPKLFMNATVTFSDYEYEIRNEFSIFTFELGSDVQDYTGKIDFSYQPNPQHSIRFGASGTYHEFQIGRLRAGSDDGAISFNAGQSLFGNQYGLYVNDEYEASEDLKINAGLRLSGFSFQDEFFTQLEPRFSLKYSLSDNLSLKTSYARMAQYQHLVSNSAAALPTDIWYPSTAGVQPEVSDQVVGGVSYAINEDWIITNEVFYKWLDNQIDFKPGANLFVNDNLEDEFVFGKGWSYGNEFYLEKKRGKLTGWFGYTLSYSWRQFDDILEGRKFPYRFDRRHDISIVALYQLNKKWNFSASWVYNTGNAVSIPQSLYLSQDIDGTTFQIIPVYSDRNSFRIPAYHRLDLGVVYNMEHRWGTSDITLSIYNAYDRRNVYFIYIDSNQGELTETDDGTNRPLELADTPNLRFEAKQVSLFPILPSLTWNFKF